MLLFVGSIANCGVDRRGIKILPMASVVDLWLKDVITNRQKPCLIPIPPIRI